MNVSITMSLFKKACAAAVALAALAGAAPGPVLDDRASGVELFRFKVHGGTAQTNNKFLSGGEPGIGIYRASTNVTVYGIQSLDSKDMTELHTYPIGIVDHVLALVGTKDLLTLKDEVHVGSSFPSEGNGTVVDADHFQVIDGFLKYAGGMGGEWALYPATAGYVLRWYAGGITTDDYLPVQIQVVDVGKGSFTG